jgi:hypothetical protein
MARFANAVGPVAEQIDEKPPDPCHGRIGLRRHDARPGLGHGARAATSRHRRLLLAADHAAVPDPTRGRRTAAADARGVLPRADWVLSGSVSGWGNELIPFRSRHLHADAARVAPATAARARPRISVPMPSPPGGWRHRDTEEFIECASHYEDGTREGRNSLNTNPGSSAGPARSCALMDGGRSSTT